MNASAMSVRATRPDDDTECARIRAQLWPKDHGAEISRYFASTPEDCRLRARSRRCITCGFINVSERAYAEGSASTPVACVEALHVDEDVHRCGGGARPMAAAELWTRNRGLRELASDGELGNHASIAAHAERIVCWRKPLA